MVVSRRVFISSSIALAAMGKAHAAPSRFIDLTYSAGRLSWPGGGAVAACGRSGVRPDKREGDGATPAGRFPLLRRILPRRSHRGAADRVCRCRALRPDDGWVDDPADPRYNRLVALPYPAHHEEMWRADGLYDLLVVIGYNTDPPLPGRGSAIFLHVARPDFAPTVGCIAVARDVLAGLLGSLGPGSMITIRP